jgi:hypothetical protein
MGSDVLADDHVEVITVKAVPGTARSELLFSVLMLLSPGLIWWGPSGGLLRLRWVTDSVVGGALYTVAVFLVGSLLLRHAAIN